MIFPSATFADRPSRIALAIIAALLLVRLVFVILSPLELYADEAQYWRWSQTPDWGYYSKPPMIAWLITFSTTVFGDAEWAIRILAPVCHAVAGFALFLLGRKMFGNYAGLAAVCAYLLMPGVTLSSGVISTDTVLLPFWCLALYLLWGLRLGESGWLRLLALGAAISAGFLSKYAMIYFMIGIVFVCVFDAPGRQALWSRAGATLATIVAVMLTPHIVWHMNNRFKTLNHTLDNANLGGSLFNPEHFPGFIADQMGVFGPVSLVLLVIALLHARFKPDTITASAGTNSAFTQAKVVWLSCFILPVLVIIACQAVLSRAHANWAATAYPAASILIAGFVANARSWRPVFWFGIALQAGLAAFISALVLGPSGWSGALGRDNDLKRVRGWQILADQLVTETQRMKPAAILVDEREIWHNLDYYTRGRLKTPLILWRYHAGPKNFAEEYASMDDVKGEPVLVASYHATHRVRIKADFGEWEPAGLIGVDLGHRPNGCPLRRELRFYLARNHAPLQRDTNWIMRFKRQNESGQWADIHLDRPPPCPAPGHTAHQTAAPSDQDATGPNVGDMP